MDWQSAIKGFRAYLKLERSLSDNSIEAYSRDIEKLYQFAEIQPSKPSPEAIKLADLRQFIVWAAELGMLPSSQARILSGIKAFYKYLLMEDRIKSDPSELLESPKIQRKLPDTLSIDEVNKLIDANDVSKPEGARNKAILEVLYERRAMPLASTTQRDIEQYIGEQLAAPMFFPPFTAAMKPTSLKFRYRGIYITDTGKPAWMDASGTWRYADGSSV